MKFHYQDDILVYFEGILSKTQLKVQSQYLSADNFIVIK